MHRVLIIEDEQDIRDILSIVLTRLGYDVVAAENGKKGVDLFNNAPFFDLVITDIRMPGMSGNDVAKHIRASRK
jgi:CheY-like chemotaxis protein